MFRRVLLVICDFFYNTVHLIVAEHDLNREKPTFKLHGNQRLRAVTRSLFSLYKEQND